MLFGCSNIDRTPAVFRVDQDEVSLPEKFAAKFMERPVNRDTLPTAKCIFGGGLAYAGALRRRGHPRLSLLEKEKPRQGGT